MAHINLTCGADAIVIAPASADVMARLVHGQADDLLSLACLARADRDLPAAGGAGDEPRMWAHPATQRNAAQLRAPTA